MNIMVPGVHSDAKEENAEGPSGAMAQAPLAQATTAQARLC